jgi:hypothetical protein
MVMVWLNILLLFKPAWLIDCNYIYLPLVRLVVDLESGIYEWMFCACQGTVLCRSPAHISYQARLVSLLSR